MTRGVLVNLIGNLSHNQVACTHLLSLSHNHSGCTPPFSFPYCLDYHARARVETFANLRASGVTQIVCGTIKARGKREVEEVVLEFEGCCGDKAKASAVVHGGAGGHFWID